ncbi:MAG: FAD-binding oxidoreductase [Rhodospirillaceae bacterium]|jgi:hydrogen cyanide synthase HcnC|nr:FAD-binding oxidoreductase [Rhodospirillales bacterium]MBT4934825.1 FAD-binding oxidoreductase [Rhodospirillaceae bacterium]MBT5244425.1 FAD-binding oxidoreductase [Rhodospirillaceae bacterium]MBT5562265.1 FAD-binding oxidoreductase [Rhodospirillaceae bacterium]MBT6240734.1 FAD-binding oxidoreductase [Rhodospirillaceae bacterium]
MSVHDAIVVGGGLVGSALAYGLQRRGLSTIMLDEGDIAFRAARGNFGLIWVQSKGVDFSPYAQWTWKSAESWADLSAEFEEITGVDVGYLRPGGADICVDAKEFEAKRKLMQRLQSHSPHINYEMLDRKAMADMLPGLGPDVAGGCYCPADGHVNPLSLLRSLHQCLKAKGGRIETGGRVTAIQHQESSFVVETAKARYHGARLVVAAGLGTRDLAAMIGMKVPVRPVRGQTLVTERLKPFLPMPLSKVRQTAEGSVQLGASSEDVGFDEGTSSKVMNDIAARAVRVFPHLRRASVVRAWGSLRVMTPDAYPIYEQSEQYPGAFAAVCHSGVTLAASHVFHLAASIAEGSLSDSLSPMRAARFPASSAHA